jgi:hypothetical protein
MADTPMLETLSIIGMLLTIMNVIFLLGRNWHRVTALEESQQRFQADALKARDDVYLELQEYVRKDIMALELAAVKSRLDRFSEQLTYLTGQEHDRQLARERSHGGDRR